MRLAFGSDIGRCMALAAIMAAAAGGTARAQKAATEYQEPLSAAQPQPSQDLFSLVNLGKDLGADLAARGIYLRGAYMADTIGDVDGGRKTNSALFTSMFLAGVDLDMNKILHIPGGSLHITVADRNGPELGRFTGAALDEPDTYGPLGQDAFRLTDFYWRQTLFHDHLRFEVGRTQWTPEFATSELYPLFVGWDTINVAGPMVNTGAPQFDVSYWGGRVTLKPTPDTYLRAGAYEVNPNSPLSNHQGFPGSDWSGHGATGFMVPIEIGDKQTFADRRYPHTIDVGLQYDSSPYADFYYNNKGLSRAANGGAPLTHHVRSTFYWQLQQVIWRPNPASNRSLQLFASGSYKVQGYPVISNSFQIGLVQRGTFASRPDDTVGLVFDYWQLNPRISENFNTQSALAGGRGHLHRNESIVEINYGYEVAPGLFARPFAQFINHPDQFGIAKADQRDNHAVVVGLQLYLQFAQAFGLPAFPSKF